MKLAAILTSIFLAAVLSGCASPEKYAQQRRERLLMAYPVGTTTRANVQQHRGSIKADVSEARPAAGWADSSNAAVRERCLASERRTGKQVVNGIGDRMAPLPFAIVGSITTMPITSLT